MSITMRQMLEAGVHFGHQTRYWNPKMAPYIYGNRNHIHIIDIQQTLPLMKEACSYAEKIASNGGKILFVGTKRAARDNVSAAASDCNMPYVNYRWLGGMLTNFNTVKQSIKRLKSLEEDSLKENQELTKKEQLLQSREIQKLKKELYTIIADHSGKDYDEVWNDSDRDYWMTSTEAKNYGMIDEVLMKKK